MGKKPSKMELSGVKWTIVGIAFFFSKCLFISELALGKLRERV